MVAAVTVATPMLAPDDKEKVPRDNNLYENPRHTDPETAARPRTAA